MFIVFCYEKYHCSHILPRHVLLCNNNQVIKEQQKELVYDNERSIIGFYVHKEYVVVVHWNVMQSLEKRTKILARGPINKPITIIGICD